MVGSLVPGTSSFPPSEALKGRTLLYIRTHPQSSVEYRDQGSSRNALDHRLVSIQIGHLLQLVVETRLSSIRPCRQPSDVRL